MIRLLLLFVLCPCILYSQTLRKEVVDSIKAATAHDLHNVSALLGNNPHTRVEHVAVFDTGEYVTIVVRVHVARTDTITAISGSPLVMLKTEDIIAISVSTVTVPPLPAPVAEVGEVIALPLRPPIKIKEGDIVPVSAGTVTVPPLPAPVAELSMMTALPLQPLVSIKEGDIVPVGVGTVTIPPLPAPVAEVGMMIVLPPSPLVRIKEGDIIMGSVSTVSLPPLPRPVTEAINALPLQPPAMMKTGNIPAVSMNRVTIPTLPAPVAEMGKLIALLPLPLVRIKEADIVVAGATTIVVHPLPPIVAEAEPLPVAGLHLSEYGYSLLEKLEGFSSELYSLNDGGFTIGFGFFVPYAEGNKWDNGVTLEEAERIMRQKVPAYEDQVKRYINVPVTQFEFDALTMLAYNLGGFSKATSIVNDINAQVEFDKLQRDWNRFVHSKAPGVTKGLMNRRKDELGVKKYADYQPERKIPIRKIRQ